MYKVVRLFQYQEGVSIEKEVLEGMADVYERPSYTEDEIIENAKDADAIICIYEPITKKVIDALPNLKMISYKAIGFNSVDLEYATQKNIAVSHTTHYCTKEVADYVMSAILLSNRKILQFHHSVKYDKKWDFMLFPEITRLEEQTVGFIGFGNIPKLVSKRLQPFGCKMMAYDPFVTEDIAREYGVELVDKKKLFEGADYISCHLPLNPQTEKSIGKEDFENIKNSAVFINSARGGVVNEKDLLEALDSGKISFAVLDVLSDEHPDLDNTPLALHDNVLLTPHIAFYSKESARDGRRDSAQNIKNFFEKNYKEVELVNKVVVD